MKDGASQVRQVIQGGAGQSGLLGSFQSTIGRRRSVLDFRRRGGELQTRSFAAAVEKRVTGDLEQPATQVRAGGERVEPFERLEERFLGKILGVLRMACHSE